MSCNPPIETHTNALADYLPGGRTFEAKRIGGSNLRQLLFGLAGELFRAQGFVCTLNEEYLPDKTALFLDEWESALGIPDECFTPTVRSTDWAQIGDSLAVTGISLPTLAALNSTDVAFIDQNNDELRTYRFDGADWVQVGNSLLLAPAGGPALAALSGNRVAFIDALNDELRTYDFDGTDWAQVGNGLPIAGTGSLALAALNGTDVVLLEDSNDELQTYRFDGTDWAPVGNSLPIAGANNVAMSALSGNRIAYIDGGNDELRTYDFDGTDWAQVGNGLPIAGVASRAALAALDSTGVALIGRGDQELQTYRFDGTDWAPVGDGLAIAGTGPLTWFSVSALSSAEIAYIDSSNGEMRTYGFLDRDLTDDERLRNILLKLTSYAGVQTVEDFQALADQFDIGATVTPGEDTTLPLPHPKFTVVVQWTSAEGNEDQIDIVRCLFNTLKPANVVILFVGMNRFAQCDEENMECGEAFAQCGNRLF